MGLGAQGRGEEERSRLISTTRVVCVCHFIERSEYLEISGLTPRPKLCQF